MVDSIRNCSKCSLCNYQLPLLDNIDVTKKYQIFWVGLSAKKVTFQDEKPLSYTTNSGKLICDIEQRCNGILTYKTNLVKCVPLDEQFKLRYPNRKEIDLCIPNLEMEILNLKPKIVFLLGEKVAKSVSKYFQITFESWDGYKYKYVKHKGIYYIPIHHPSYIFVYKRKEIEDYIVNIENLISELLWERVTSFKLLIVLEEYY